MSDQTRQTAHNGQHVGHDPRVRGSQENLIQQQQGRQAGPKGPHSGRVQPAFDYPESGHSHHTHFKTDAEVYDIPSHIYDRYNEEAEAERQRTLSRRKQQPRSGSQDVGEFTTLYIPKVKGTEGGLTLKHRRRASSKRRSSSRRRAPVDDYIELLDSDEDNHLLPSLRLQRRIRMKSLKDRKIDLERDEAEGDTTDKSFANRFQEMKDADDITAANFAGLLRDSTLNRIKKIGDWKRPKRWDRYKRRSREYFQHFMIWVSSFKEIEGKFGTAVMGYFRFVRWLMFLNVYIMIIMFGVITFPFLILKPHDFSESVDIARSDFHSQAVNCSREYREYDEASQARASTFNKVLDFLSGTGWMERTVLFYGMYHNKTYYLWGSDGLQTLEYNMPLAYLLAIGCCFIISFLLIVKNSAKTVKSTFGRESALAAFNNRVFAGWDYAICKKEAAEVKKNNIYTEFMDSLFEENLKRKRENRSNKEKCTIYSVRVFINIIVLGVLAGALFLVYYTTDKLLELQKKQLNEIVALIVQYLPYLTITILNFAIPLIFQKIVQFEDYPHGIALRITLARSICLRLASLGVLIGSLYRLLIIDTDPTDGFCGNRRWAETANSTSGSIKCWETYVGQQIYKLVLLDLIVETVIVVFVMFPRSLLYNRYGKSFKLIKKIGPQEFDLPQSVIDIIYAQTLCWLGLFFSPLIPFMTFLKCIIFFYIRKWILMNYCVPAKERFRTSRSNSLFMTVTLFSFILSAVPIGYMINSIPPSQSCGPYRVYSTSKYRMFDVLSNTIATWPIVLKDIVLFLGTVGFFIPLIIILLLLMYFYWLLGQGYKKREKILSHQLKLEGKDKQFLFARVNEVLSVLAD